MIRTTLRMGSRSIAVTAAAFLFAACGLDSQEQPSLIGPADLGVSIAMNAAPDQLPRDGSSQALITLIARDPSNRPIVGQRLSLALGTGSPAGASLSQSEVTTNSQGNATFSVGAPAQGSTGNSIVVMATPVGTNADNSRARVLSISVNPSNASAPTPAFIVTPAAPEVGQVATFDASTTMDEGAACNSCSYVWNFGGDGTATGIVVTHVFSSGGGYQVTLTATDSAGTSGTRIQTVNVTAPSIPTGLSVTASPAQPFAKQTATFTAAATASPNHRIVSYQFSWGDGDTTSSATPVVQHTYSQSGQMLLTLTVRDDLGQSSTTNVVITVASGLTASFVFAPANPAAGATVTFNASASTSQVASTISDYAWDFDGDGTYDTNGSSPFATTSFASGTYRPTLKITDSRGVTQTSAQNLTVP
jgi:PKD repeat protein